jgi:hypothetical protein
VEATTQVTRFSELSILVPTSCQRGENHTLSYLRLPAEMLLRIGYIDMQTVYGFRLKD